MYCCRLFSVGILAALLATDCPAHAIATLERIRLTHTLRCGVIQETPEYSTSDDHGQRELFDVEICRAVAIAILGPNAEPEFAEYPDDVSAVVALQGGAADLVPTLTDDLTHASDSKLTFSRPILYDGVGFLVPSTSKIAHAEQLSGKKICLLAETHTEVAVRKWFTEQHRHEHLDFVPFPFQEEGEMQAAFVSGNCAALAGDWTRLGNTRARLGPSKYTLLPEQISKDPLAAASHAGDPAFATIVHWVLQLLINAEESGITKRRVLAAALKPDPAKPDPALTALAAETRELSTRFGLPEVWATDVLAAVGNYGEIYDRQLGGLSKMKLPRGLNRLYTQGGLLYALPFK